MRGDFQILFQHHFGDKMTGGNKYGTVELTDSIN